MLDGFVEKEIWHTAKVQAVRVTSEQYSKIHNLPIVDVRTDHNCIFSKDDLAWAIVSGTSGLVLRSETGSFDEEVMSEHSEDPATPIPAWLVKIT